MLLKIVFALAILNVSFVMGMIDKDDLILAKSKRDIFFKQNWSKEEMFLGNLITELEIQIEALKQKEIEKEEERRRKIVNKHLIKTNNSHRFLNDFFTWRY